MTFINRGVTESLLEVVLEEFYLSLSMSPFLVKLTRSSILSQGVHMIH